MPDLELNTLEMAAMQPTLDLLAVDPFLAPDWRWRRAQQVVAGELPRRRGLDEAVKTAITFYVSHLVPDPTPDRCLRRHPHDQDIATAMELHESGGLVAAEVRARILAGQSDAEIAERCGLESQTVEWYGSLFFDVRPRLNAAGYIAANVIGAGPWNGFQDHDVAGLWAWLAWSGGPPILDLLVDSLHAAMKPGKAPTLSTYLRRDANVRSDVQCVVAAAVLPHRGPAGAALMPLQARLLEAQTASDRSGVERRVDRVRRDLVRVARDFLAGKPITLRPASKSKKEVAARSAGGGSPDQQVCGRPGTPSDLVAQPG